MGDIYFIVSQQGEENKKFFTYICNMNTIYSYLQELTRCDYSSFTNHSLEEFTYNNISYAQGVESYNRILSEKEKSFKGQILEQSSSNNFNCIINAVLADFKKKEGLYYDIPNDDDIASMERDYSTSHNQSLLNSIREAKFLREMVSLQRLYLNNAVIFLMSLSEEKDSGRTDFNITNKEIKEDVEHIDLSKEDEYVHGVKGLAVFLNCGTSKAQAIINSKILEKTKPRIQQYVGGWQFHKERLSEFIDKNPEALRNIKCPH